MKINRHAICYVTVGENWTVMGPFGFHQALRQKQSYNSNCPEMATPAVVRLSDGREVKDDGEIVE